MKYLNVYCCKLNCTSPKINLIKYINVRYVSFCIHLLRTEVQLLYNEITSFMLHENIRLCIRMFTYVVTN